MNRRDLLPKIGLVCLGAVIASSRSRAVTAPTGPAATALTDRDRADLARVETYLNGIHTLRARFIQIAPDGAISGGTAWIDRPGKMRFAYDPPSPLLLVASHGDLIFHDSALQQTSYLGLASTPLGVLLQDQIKLSGDITVTGISRSQGELDISLVRTKTPDDGSLTLVFADPPLVLRSWTIVDRQRRATRVNLFDIQTGGTFDQQLFHFENPGPPAKHR
jgi:outer membrane lipoprotein-sorting protein